MDRRQQLRERIIATYWEIHLERNCGRCEQPEPGQEDEASDAPVEPDPAGPGPADSRL